MNIHTLRECADRTTRGWTGVTAFAVVAPMLGIVVARLLQPIASPATASAAGPDNRAQGAGTDVAPQTHFFRPVSDDEAAEYAAMQSPQIAGLSGTPLVKLAGEPGAAASRVEIIDAAPVITPPAMGLTSIMATKSQPIAVVGGKLLRVGDEVCPGWKIGHIDSDAGTVSLVHESGFEHVLNLRQ